GDRAGGDVGPFIVRGEAQLRLVGRASLQTPILAVLGDAPGEAQLVITGIIGRGRQRDGRPFVDRIGRRIVDGAGRGDVGDGNVGRRDLDAPAVTVADLHGRDIRAVVVRRVVERLLVGRGFRQIDVLAV